MNDWVESTVLSEMFRANDNIALTSPDLIRMARHSDSQYTKLIEVIQEGFPKTHSLTIPEVRIYWVVGTASALTTV